MIKQSHFWLYMQRKFNQTLKKYLHPSVHCRSTHNSKGVETTNNLSVHLWEKAMAPHSSTVARKIPWMEEPGGLQSMESLESDTTEAM